MGLDFCNVVVPPGNSDDNSSITNDTNYFYHSIIRKDFACVVCQQLASLDSYITNNCNHLICKDCLPNEGMKQCPICTTPVGELRSFREAQPLSYRILEKVRVKHSDNDTNNCWTGEYGQLQNYCQYLKNCQYLSSSATAPATQPLSSSQIVSMKMRRRHDANNTSNRSIDSTSNNSTNNDSNRRNRSTTGHNRGRKKLSSSSSEKNLNSNTNATKTRSPKRSSKRISPFRRRHSPTNLEDQQQCYPSSSETTTTTATTVTSTSTRTRSPKRSKKRLSPLRPRGSTSLTNLLSEDRIIRSAETYSNNNNTNKNDSNATTSNTSSKKCSGTDRKTNTGNKNKSNQKPRTARSAKNVSNNNSANSINNNSAGKISTKNNRTNNTHNNNKSSSIQPSSKKQQQQQQQRTSPSLSPSSISIKVSAAASKSLKSRRQSPRRQTIPGPASASTAKTPKRRAPSPKKSSSLSLLPLEQSESLLPLEQPLLPMEQSSSALPEEHPVSRRPRRKSPKRSSFSDISLPELSSSFHNDADDKLSSAYGRSRSMDHAYYEDPDEPLQPLSTAATFSLEAAFKTTNTIPTATATVTRRGAMSERDFYTQCAEAHLASDEYQKCISACKEALKIDPASRDAFQFKSRAQLELGLFDDAVSTLTAAASRLPKSDKKIQTYLAHAKHLSQTIARLESLQANKAFLEIIRMTTAADNNTEGPLESNNKFCLLIRANAFLNLNDTNSAIREATNVINIDPNSVEALLIRSKANYLNANIEHALMDAEMATKIDKSNSKVKEAYKRIKIIAEGFQEIDNRQVSEKTKKNTNKIICHQYSDLIRLVTPTLPNYDNEIYRKLYRGKAQAHLDEGSNYNKALLCIDNVLESDPKDIDAWVMKIVCLENLDRHIELVKQLDAVVVTSWGSEQRVLSDAHQRALMHLMSPKSSPNSSNSKNRKKYNNNKNHGGAMVRPDMVASPELLAEILTTPPTIPMEISQK